MNGSRHDGKGYVYLLRSETTGWHKIGHSADPIKRVRVLSAEWPELKFVLLLAITSADPRRLEQAVHAVFAHCRISRDKEWFKLGRVELELLRAMSRSAEDDLAKRLQENARVLYGFIDDTEPHVLSDEHKKALSA